MTPLPLSRETSLLSDTNTFPAADAFLMEMPLQSGGGALPASQPPADGAPLAGSAAPYNAVQVCACLALC